MTRQSQKQPDHPTILHALAGNAPKGIQPGPPNGGRSAGADPAPAFGGRQVEAGCDLEHGGTIPAPPADYWRECRSALGGPSWRSGRLIDVPHAGLQAVDAGARGRRSRPQPSDNDYLARVDDRSNGS